MTTIYDCFEASVNGKPCVISRKRGHSIQFEGKTLDLTKLDLALDISGASLSGSENDIVVKLRLRPS